MRINYHILSSKISDRQTFREYIHGASRYTQLVNTSFIKIKNSIKTALKAILKPRINNVAFSNSKFLTRVLFLFHAKSRNEIKFDDDSTFLIRENVKSKEENTIKIENKNTSSFIVSKIIKSKNNSDIVVQGNNSSLLLSEKLKIDNNNNNIQVKNNEVHMQIGVFNKSNEDNKINFTNGKVNMSAGYLIRLKMMSGSLNSYYNQTISETGRKKII
ncbi:hypothetical protein [Roseburia faecis]|jgi:hypothetical protein|uniref:hypothetical protein n=1 Tax=Roseburia faecis TaxID=301302 RepID=UPI0031B5DC5F